METHSALVILRPVVWEGVAMAHILRAVAGVDRQLVLRSLVPQVHCVPQVRLQLLQAQKPLNLNPKDNRPPGQAWYVISNACKALSAPASLPGPA